MVTVCLATNELYPVTHGGCGMLIYNSIYALLDSGFHVIVLADIDAARVQAFRAKHLAGLPSSGRLELHCLSSLIGAALHDTPSHRGLKQSWRFYVGLRRLIQGDSRCIDLVELPEYEGYAYHILLNRGEFPESLQIFVRFHLSMEWIDRAAPYLAPTGVNRLLTYGLERWCIGGADSVLVPTDEVAQKVRAYYAPRDLRVSTPSFSALKIGRRRKCESKYRILFYARLAPQKGSDLFVRAAVKWLQQDANIGEDVRLSVAGPDMRGGPGGAWTVDYLRNLIPLDLLWRFEFLGNLDATGREGLLPTVLFAVFPTRAETYCYGARELAIAGVPLLCSDIPELRDLAAAGNAVGVTLTEEAWAGAIAAAYGKERGSCGNDRYWEPKGGLAEAYTPKKMSPEKLSQRRASEKTHVLFFLFRERAVGNVEPPLNGLLATLPFRATSVVATEDEAGHFLLRNKTWWLSGPVVDDATIICFLDAMDVVPADYLKWAVGKIENDQRVTVVSCPVLRDGDGAVEEVPMHLVPGLLPFLDAHVLKRVLLRFDERTKDACFDPFMHELHEVAGIWELLARSGARWIHTQQWHILARDSMGRAPTSSGCRNALHALLGRHDEMDMIPGLSRTLSHLVLDSTQTMDLRAMLKEGATPEIGRMRFNCSGISDLLFLRVKSTAWNLLRKRGLSRPLM